MSLAAAIARVEEIQGALSPRIPEPVQVTNGGAAAPAALASAATAGGFSNLLDGALAGRGVTIPGVFAPNALPGAGGALPVNGGAGFGNQLIVQLAQRELGQAEFPPGSNDSPRIAEYRTATAGSGVGPWCAYFTSWLGQQAGMPLGDDGQGFGRVDDVYAWAQRVGRAVPNGPGAVPRPGDLIVWDEHIGIVEQVLPDGRVQTIEGNSSDQVKRNVHEAGSALGYVRMS
ncbi:CHAP domain-containing protein [Conexibacter arvalis]|uniref:Peptidase C51 domain-containing protein n=1 Tax=Conexibacter arvalis TaxID=912552 RepID=A0A840I9H0_9ACTN|nr:CHAP domain-containing protein [Conexibacter arvalis]MBB4660975.1 hypothetical protein [Conexibacter arvalis]